MSQKDSDFWNQARLARAKLEDQILDHPEVSLIDIGFDPESDKQAIVLRVHVKRVLTLEALGLPAMIDNIPLRVIRADYKLE